MCQGAVWDGQEAEGWGNDACEAVRLDVPAPGEAARRRRERGEESAGMSGSSEGLYRHGGFIMAQVHPWFRPYAHLPTCARHACIVHRAHGMDARMRCMRRQRSACMHATGAMLYAGGQSAWGSSAAQPGCAGRQEEQGVAAYREASEDSAPSSDGSGPLSALLCTANLERRVKLPSWEGRRPLRLFLWNSLRTHTREQNKEGTQGRRVPRRAGQGGRQGQGRTVSS